MAQQSKGGVSGTLRASTSSELFFVMYEGSGWEIQCCACGAYCITCSLVHRCACAALATRTIAAIVVIINFISILHPLLTIKIISFELLPAAPGQRTGGYGCVSAQQPPGRPRARD
jgi:hypothetical protein